MCVRYAGTLLMSSRPRPRSQSSICTNGSRNFFFYISKKKYRNKKLFFSSNFFFQKKHAFTYLYKKMFTILMRNILRILKIKLILPVYISLNSGGKSLAERNFHCPLVSLFSTCPFCLGQITAITPVKLLRYHGSA